MSEIKPETSSGLAGCDFHDLQDDYRYINPLASSQLVIGLPITSFRPEAMRVTERVPEAGDRWFEVEIFSASQKRWIEVKQHPTAELAVNDANNWYPAPTSNYIEASEFVCELIDSVDSLTDISDRHGARTLNDLMHLYQAILNGGFIDHYPKDSKALEVAKDLPSGERWAKFIETEYLAQPLVRPHTDAEAMVSLPGAVMRLNSESLTVEVIQADGQLCTLDGKPAIESFGAESGLNAWDKSRLASLDALGSVLGRDGKSVDDVPVVESGRYIGPVLATKDGIAIQDSGRGNLVGHDLSKFDQAPKAGDKLDVKYVDGLAKAANALTQDTHSVGISMHTR